MGHVDDKYGETVGAFVRPVVGAAIDEAELFTYARQRLAPHKTPKRWIAVHEFPLTGSSKIQKYVLRQRWGRARSQVMSSLILRKMATRACDQPAESV